MFVSISATLPPHPHVSLLRRQSISIPPVSVSILLFRSPCSCLLPTIHAPHPQPPPPPPALRSHSDKGKERSTRGGERAMEEVRVHRQMWREDKNRRCWCVFSFSCAFPRRPIFTALTLQTNANWPFKEHNYKHASEVDSAHSVNQWQIRVMCVGGQGDI